MSSAETNETEVSAGAAPTDNVVPPDYPRVRDLGGGVLQLDTGHYGNPGTIAVFALPLPSGGFALIESGPASSRAAVEAALREANLDPLDLRFMLVTHIHLDHAGGAGALSNAAGAELIVHEKGARHLIDPSRLMASAERVYGDDLAPLWGYMTPAKAEHVTAVLGGETLDLGGLKVSVIATPGHASHHVSYLVDDGTLFVGDSAGVRLPGAEVIRPALPPPDLDLEAWQQSVKLMRAAGPERLILTHFGPITGADAADAHLANVLRRNEAWSEEVLAGLRAGEDDDTLIERMKTLEDSEMAAAKVLPGIAQRYRVTSDAAMTVMGLKRYFTKFHPERLS